MPRQKSTHVDDPGAVGARLKAARLEAGLSQRQLAFTGCSPAYISRIEAGDRIPSLQLLRELGRRLGVSEDFLATGEETQFQTLSMLEAEIALRLDDQPTRAAPLRRGARPGGDSARALHRRGGPRPPGRPPRRVARGRQALRGRARRVRLGRVGASRPRGKPGARVRDDGRARTVGRDPRALPQGLPGARRHGRGDPLLLPPRGRAVRPERIRPRRGGRHERPRDRAARASTRTRAHVCTGPRRSSAASRATPTARCATPTRRSRHSS